MPKVSIEWGDDVVWYRNADTTHTPLKGYVKMVQGDMVSIFLYEGGPTGRTVDGVMHVSDPDVGKNPLTRKSGCWDKISNYHLRLKQQDAERQKKAEVHRTNRAEERKAVTDAYDVLDERIIELAAKGMPVKEITAALQLEQRKSPGRQVMVTFQRVNKVLRERGAAAPV